MSYLSTLNKKVREEVALQLHKIGGIKFGEFTLTSGRTSPYYVDLRLTLSHPDLFDKLTEICAKIIREEISEPIDRIAGIPTSGLPFATLTSYKLHLPLIYVRAGRKVHGREREVEGSLEEGDNIIVIDDVATTGGSIKDAAKAIMEKGGTVKHAVVILDREEGAEKALKADDIYLHKYIGILELVKHLRNVSILDMEKYSQVIDYLKEAPEKIS